MIIWLIQTGEIIPTESSDRWMRTALLGKELEDRGHKVIWWSSAFEHQRKKWVAPNKKQIVLKPNLKVLLLKGISYNSNVSIRRYIDHLIIANRFVKETKKLPKPDMIINSLPEHNLAYKVQKFAERNNIPTITDLRDYWPDFILTFFKNKYVKKIAKIVLYRDFKRSRYVLRNTDILISMMKSMLKWGQIVSNRINLINDQIFYLGSESISKKNNKEFSLDFNSLLKRIETTFNILYIGTFTDIHNPISIIKAAKALNRNNQYKTKFRFIIAGDGILLNNCKKLGSGIDNIHFPGWLNKNQITSLLEASNLGVIPINSDEDFFPNKTFSYFSAGVPIISSAKGELWDLIEKRNLGFNYSSKDYEQLSKILIYCFNNSELLKSIERNVIHTFNNEFNSKIIYKKYAELIENFQ